MMAGRKLRFAPRSRATRKFAAASRDLAELYARTGRNGDAKKVYADLLLTKATDTTALLGLADIAIAEKKWSEAVALLNRARAREQV